MACPGSVALIDTVPARPSSPYAEEGTLAHAFAAYMLQNGDRSAGSYIGATLDAQVGATPLSEEMANAIQIYLNEVWTEYDLSPEAEFYVEKGFVLDVASAVPGEVFGTNDALVYHPTTGRLRIFDYKHGAGVSVTADENAQLKFYAAGAVFSNPTWKLSEVILTIVQPRARDVDTLGAVRDWPMQTIDLLEFQGDVDAAIKRAKQVENYQELPTASSATADKDDPSDRFDHLVLGPHCRWCDAAAICPAREAEIMEAAKLPFSDMTKITVDDLPIVSELDTARLGQILKAGSLLNDWLATVQEYVEALLMQGHGVPGWKVVEKIGRAKWVEDQNQIAAYADMMFGVEADQIMPRKLTTIGDAEKLLKAAGAKKDDVDSFKLKFTIKDSSGLTIAPESDRRPAVSAAQDVFGDIKI